MNKYRSKRTKCRQGHTHDSAKESRRCDELHLLQRGGAIGGLEIQRPYVIEVGGQKICKYVADFVYTEKGEFVVEDSKGYRTPEYRLKRKLMAAIYSIEVRET